MIDEQNVIYGRRITLCSPPILRTYYTILLYFGRIMIKYPFTARQTYNEPLSPIATSQHPKDALRFTKPIIKCDFLTFSSHSQNNHTITPTTPRTPNNTSRFSKQLDTTPKSIHVTPNKERIRKGASFVLLKQPEIVAAKQSFDPPKEVHLDRSQRVFKNLGTNEPARKVSDMCKLRQTVSSATSWQYRNLVPSGEKKEGEAPKKGEEVIRKKIQSQYCEMKDFKSKFATAHHSRNNSRTECAATFTDRSFNKTPRVSQDKLVAPVKKEKSTNLTDSGNNIHLTLSRRAKGEELRIEDFQMGACKGEGRFGKVFPAVHKKTGFLCAIKQVAKESVKFMLQQFVQEIKISLYLSHPNIVRMYGCFADRDSIYILMEYMEEGSLYRLVKLAKRFSEVEASTKLYEICEAVQYMHSQDILHRDIKPENIVLSNGVSKLCDFGWAAYSRERRTTYCGTLDYVCPQILEGESYDNFVDIWAIGVLAFEMLVGKAPFYHISRKETMKSILNCQFSFPADLSASARQFIARALQKNPDQRFTIDSLLKDHFLEQASH